MRLIITVLTLVIAYLLYCQIFGTHGYPSDIRQHLGFVRQIMDGELTIPHPLWFYMVGFCSYICRFTYELSAWFISLAIFIMTIILTAITIQKQAVDASKWLKNAILFSSMVIASFYIPGLSHFIYLGVGGPNIWHNVTYSTVRLIGIIILLMSIYTFNQSKTKYYVGLIALLLLSMLAKPSFMMIYLPSITVWVILRKKYDPTKLTTLITMWVSSIGILLWQASLVNDTENHVIIDYLGVWSLNNDNILVAIITGLMFPLVYIAVNFKSLYEDDFLLISWGMLFVGLIIAMLFAEDGERYRDGNFMWGYSLAMFYVYLFSMISFVKNMCRIKLHYRYMLSAILFYQTMIGIFYLGKILHGESVV